MNVKIITTLVLSCLLAACGSEDESAPIILTNVDETDQANDSFATAQTIEMNALVSGSLTQEETPELSDYEDFYKVQVTSRGMLEIRLEGVDLNPVDESENAEEEAPEEVVEAFDVDMDLYRVTADDEDAELPVEQQNPDLVESSYSNENSESISVEIQENEVGTYYIKVEAARDVGTGTYSLSVYQ